MGIQASQQQLPFRLGVGPRPILAEIGDVLGHLDIRHFRKLNNS